MASSLKNIFLFTFLLSALAILNTAANADESFAETPSLDELRLRLKSEKLTHLHFYWHDSVFVANPTAVKVAEAATSNRSSTFFGTVLVFDGPLTMGPNKTSKPVGRAQGIYGFTSQEEISYLMAMNIVFTRGKYNGSSIAILGRNPSLNKVREMPIVGGTGTFRLARGYVQIRTFSADIPTGSAVVEYNVYVLHY